MATGRPGLVAHPTESPVVGLQEWETTTVRNRALVLFALSRGEKCFKCHNDGKELH